MNTKSPFVIVFLVTILAAGMIVSAIVINSKRPMADTAKASAQMVRASGKCAVCHRRETSAIVHQFEMSKHAKAGITCLDCHQPEKGQEKDTHNGFILAKTLTAKNCSRCHTTEYEQFIRSRHGASAWAAVKGGKDFTMAQVAHAQKYNKGTVKGRKANGLAKLEGPGAVTKGCSVCHSIGKPNKDGSIGSCTQCHGRHSSSVSLARHPRTCGQCHMGPDHSQIEIYKESKHGALFAAQRNLINLNAPVKGLTTKDMPVPTCSTCHMSGLEGAKVTHDVGERLSWYLFAAISKKRPQYLSAQNEMKGICLKCHAKTHVDKFYKDSEVVVHSTNAKVKKIKKIAAALRKDKLLTPAPFDEAIEFMLFDYWHYFGRTAKHGAFMGGPDFVQWHGNYELLYLGIKIKKEAKNIRKAAAAKAAAKAKKENTPTRRKR